MVTLTTTTTLLTRFFSPISLSNSLRRGVTRNFRFYPRNRFRACRVMNSPDGGSSAAPAPLIDSVTQDFKNQTIHSSKLKSLEDLNWDNSFVRELPSDPRTDPFPREVKLVLLNRRKIRFSICNFD